MTIEQTCKVIRTLGLTVGYKPELGEFRVNLPRQAGGTEDTAYYTDDKQDALNTARQMARYLTLMTIYTYRPSLTH